MGNARVGRPCTRRLTGLWRYDRNKGTWDKVALPAGEPDIAELTADSGPYWAEWQDGGQRSSGLVHRASAG